MPARACNCLRHKCGVLRGASNTKLRAQAFQLNGNQATELRLVFFYMEKARGRCQRSFPLRSFSKHQTHHCLMSWESPINVNSEASSEKQLGTDIALTCSLPMLLRGSHVLLGAQSSRLVIHKEDAHRMQRNVNIQF